jgi:hypothetical protein
MYLEIAMGLYILGSYAYHRWLEDKPAPPKPEDIRLPRTDDGAPLSLIYGRCRVRSPAMVFAGNYQPPTIDLDRYSIDLLFAVGIPFFGGVVSSDALGVAVYAGDVKMGTIVTPPVGDSQAGTLVASTGATSGDISVVGEMYFGSSTQNVGAIGSVTRSVMIDAGIDASLIPGYRSLVCAAFVSFATASRGLSSPVAGIPSFSFEVKSLSTGTAADLGHSLADDADPAAVIYDLLTSPWGKLALSTSKVDLPSFQTASATLFAEQHGYSRAIEQPDDASNLIDDVLRQIDGVLYEEPTTGKLVLKLIRNDYNVNVLDTITPDNARPAEGSWLSVSGWSETLNQVRVVWTNRGSGYNQGVAIGQNNANVTDQGKLRTLEVTYVGCNDQDLAHRLASRELAVVSKPIVKASVVTDRTFYQKRPGDVVKLTWPQLGISGMVMRIARVDLGQLHKGDIHLDLIRDVFDVSLGAFPYA